MEPIIFPGLGLEFYIDRIAFTILGRPIYLYGLIISIGFLLALIFALREAKRLDMNSEIIIDLVLWGTPAGIIGARLYYVIFNWSNYRGNLMGVFAIWEGGLAIYGAIIGALISTYIYCRVKKIDILPVFDIGAFGFLIGLIVGRWGNFINQEAYGRETQLPWRMEIFDTYSRTRMAVHPTFLYESLWNTIGFIILLLYRKKKKFNGEIFLMYATWYGLGRFWIEGLRTDSLHIGPLRVSQIVAALSVIIGVSIICYRRKHILQSQLGTWQE